jgi:hypothetical protein
MGAVPQPIHQLSAVGDLDCIPNDQAVWREFRGDPGLPPRLRICLEYGSGPIAIVLAHEAKWDGCRRWRFGWPPKAER